MRSGRLVAIKSGVVSSGGSGNVIYQGKSSTVTLGTGSAQNVPLTLPTGYADNDILIMVANAWGDITSSPPVTFNSQTWSLGATTVDSSSAVYGVAYWCRLASAPSIINATCTVPSNQAFQLTFFMLRGCVTTGNPFRTFRGTTQNSSQATTFAGPTITDAAATDLGVHFGGCGAGTTGRTLTVNGTGRTVDYAQGPTGSQSLATGISYKIGDSAALTWTSSASGYWVAMSAAFIPA